MSWRPGPRTRLAAVIGDPVRHSLSPVLHNAAFRALDLEWVYLAFEVAPSALPGAVEGMRALGIEGLSVTMPHKTEMVGLVDELSPTAEALDAVNCVSRRRGALVGENTDGDGFIDALLLDEGIDVVGRRTVVLGAGGAARAVIRALGQSGAGEVVVVNRTPERGEQAAALAGSVGRTGPAEVARDADIVINATPIGMGNVITPEGRAPDLPIDPELLSKGQLVVDLIYEPMLTPLLDAARDRGAVTVNGLGMLIHQAAHAFRLWTAEDPPLEVMSAAVLAELSQRSGGRAHPAESSASND
ncbi:MAG: shikimate dehydrogenase [Actinomycetota bacterium]